MKDELMLHARDKKVQHMTKDGLVEKNLATGEGERVSKRNVETSFDKTTERTRYHSDKSEEKVSSKNRRNYYRKNTQAREKGKDAGKSDRMDKLENKAQKADEKAQKAKDKVKKKRAVRYKRLYDEQTGRASHKLKFEDEIKSPTIVGSAVSKAGAAASGVVHGKVHEDGDDNYAVGGVHTLEGVAESSIRTVNHLKNEHEAHQRKKVSKLEHDAEKAHCKLRFEQEAEKNPEIKKSVSRQMQQKRQIKREYQNAQRAAQHGKKTAGSAGKAAGKTADKIKEKLAELVTKNKGVLVAFAGIGLFIILIASMLSSCGAMFSTGGGAVATSTYLSTDEAIVNTNDAYSDLEAGLQRQVDNIESTYPGYDEYRYNLDEIDHDPYALTSYLTAKYGNFKENDVAGYLQGLFDEQYELTVTPTTEIRTRTETRTGTRTIHHADGTTTTETYTYEVEVEYEYHILTVKLTNKGLDAVVTPLLNENQLREYRIYQASRGNRSYLFGDAVSGNVAGGGISYDIPPEALQDEDFRAMITEAEKYLGYPYVWGGSSPSTSFDCSGFVCWVINHSVGNVGRTTANGLLSNCTYVSPEDAMPGDLIFFQGTYNTSGASHVGIYVGNGMMIHCGNPIQYASTETNYWKNHFYCFGRLN